MSADWDAVLAETPSAEALQAAARCWCDVDTSSLEMDSRLATAFAKRIDALLLRERESAKELADAKARLAERTRELGAAQFDIRKERGIAEGYAMRTRQAESALAAMTARAEAAEKDAGRYRWIRDCWYIAGEEWPEELQHEPTRPAQFDAAIDAASGDSNA